MTMCHECEANGRSMTLLHTLSWKEGVRGAFEAGKLLKIFNVRFHLFANFFTHIH